MTTADALAGAKTGQLFIHDTMSGQKRLFEPLKGATGSNPATVGMYVCGMTVYDYCHIGHGRVMVAFDVITRHLRALGFQLKYVRNITDVDDKILRRAAENGEDPVALTERFIDAMHEDERALGVLPPDAEPRATAHIDGIIKLIQRLINQNAAYQAANGDVYFSIEAFPDYGKLNRRKVEESVAGSRVEVNEAKRHPADFVLWKAVADSDGGGEGVPPLSWDSPWGQGRPGWHIECSAMSFDMLGESFDIHGGGPDLKFPHHENEIAQSECASGQQFANVWMHAGAVRVNKEKMSKSLGNFFTIREILEKYQPEVLRFFLVSSHYRSAIDYSEQGLVEARQGLDRLYQALRDAGEQDGAGVEALNSEHMAAFDAAMNDDFNTAGAVAVLFTAARDLNKLLRAREPLGSAVATLKALGARLGLLEQDPEAYFLWSAATSEAELGEADIEQFIEQRKQAKLAGDYAESDRVRDYLLERGVRLRDTREGTSWQRVDPSEAAKA
ncbi:cysteine--tRNA ligase [Allohahella marinimesophila]|uniref:Cysteine--tRNA ligase n=1 Tax=Allohahella marinimesophila TaxID=1054972 RepID=A0ABP7NPX7_9GAMM